MDSPLWTERGPGPRGRVANRKQHAGQEWEWGWGGFQPGTRACLAFLCLDPAWVPIHPHTHTYRNTTNHTLTPAQTGDTGAYIHLCIWVYILPKRACTNTCLQLLVKIPVYRAISDASLIKLPFSLTQCHFPYTTVTAPRSWTILPIFSPTPGLFSFPVQF